MSKPRPRPVDMSVQPEQRRRKRPGRVVATPPAQLSHGTNPRAVRQRRDGERWLAVQERLREDAAVFAAGVTELGGDGFVTRVLTLVTKDGAEETGCG